MNDNQKIVWALGLMDDGSQCVIIGIPRDAWVHMKDGRTHNADFRPMGIPLSFMMFGGRSREDCINMIKASDQLRGKPVADMTMKNVNFARSSVADFFLGEIDKHGKIRITADMLPVVEELFMRGECDVDTGEHGELYLKRVVKE